ncbi:hypothetical protein GCM10009850_074720 [Nonomuraea monospora]|uniref:Serine aminopeptidase S33 domain-containing protein n=1 Tax=Nonomuraea monospora TaxID=568818 RepID=A0ABP5PJV2_9ACTN
MTISGRAQYRTRVLHDESRRDLRDPSRPRPIRLYQWEPQPRPATPAPLIIVSHGTGGSGSAMEWLVGPLVTAGFRVVALDHHGNDFIDGYEPEGFLFGWERPRDISFTLDALAKEEMLGPVGAAGFSFGGYAVAALAGARVDSQKVAAVLAETIPLPEIPEFPGVLAALRKKVAQDELLIHIDRSGADLTDARIRAVFQVAPGWGPLVTSSSLASIQIPVEIIWGGADTIAPFHEINCYLAGIPAATGRSAGPEVRHEDFFDPAATNTKARDHVARQAATFFTRHLGHPCQVDRPRGHQ